MTEYAGEYICTNVTCSLHGEVQRIRPGSPADCRLCNWSLTAQYPDTGAMA